MSLLTFKVDNARRHFGVPGGSLDSSGLDVRAVELGKQGETITAEVLDGLLDKYPNSYVFHSVKLPGRVGDIDHLIVQGNTMVLLDSKLWAGGVTYSYSDEYDEDKDEDGYINAVRILKDGEHFVGGRLNTLNQVTRWRMFKPGYNIRTVVTIVNKTAKVDSTGSLDHQLINLVPIGELESVLDGMLSTKPVDPLEINELKSFLSLLTDDEFTGLREKAVRKHKYSDKHLKARRSHRVLAFFANLAVIWSIGNYLLTSHNYMLAEPWRSEHASSLMLNGGLLLLITVALLVLSFVFKVKVKVRLFLTLGFAGLYFLAWFMVAQGTPLL